MLYRIGRGLLLVKLTLSHPGAISRVHCSFVILKIKNALFCFSYNLNLISNVICFFKPSGGIPTERLFAIAVNAAWSS